MPADDGIPWRKIYASVFAVLSVAVGVVAVVVLHRVVAWVVVALFLAVVTSPAVDLVQRRLGLRRGLATLLVLMVGFAVLGGVIMTVVRPVVVEAAGFADDAPRILEEARRGEGPFGEIVQRYELDRRLEENRDRIDRAVRGLGQNSFKIVAGATTAVAAFVTILVMAILMLIEGPRLQQGAVNLLPPDKRERVRKVTGDSARAVSGYMAGNLLISVIAGVTTFAFLVIAGIPLKAPLTLWVAVTDLIPLVGATLGAAAVVIVAFFHSVPAGIAAVIFYVIYQQFENHVLQVTIMARTVALNPLVVLLSIVVGIELAGILGALLAVPAAGIVHVIARDIYDERRGRLKDVPTIGADQQPIDETAAGGPAAGPAPAEAFSDGH